MLIRVGVCCAASALAVAGCGSADAPTASRPAAPGLSIDIRIAGGAVTPTNATLQATVGEPITLHVDSDAADELHVHSVPEHEFEVEAKPGQSFDFSVSVPGSVEVELHHLNRTVATIHVGP